MVTHLWCIRPIIRVSITAFSDALVRKSQSLRFFLAYLSELPDISVGWRSYKDSFCFA